MSTQDYKQKLSKSIGQRDYISRQLEVKEKEHDRLIQFQKDLIIAQTFLQSIAILTQSQLRIHIQDIVQLAVDTVFPGEVEFNVDFEIKNGRTAAKLVFLEQGEEIDPLQDNAGGFVDMSSLGLRVSSWSLGDTRPILILDEPCKNLDKNKRPLAAQVLRDLADELNLQMLIVTHDPELSEIADKIFQVTRVKEDGYLVSKVKEII